MTKNWYPVVDYTACVECGTCVDFCPHAVYDKSNSPSPVVTMPKKCVDHCHGCGDNCPVGAISYVGDDTGWIAPALKKTGETSKKPSSCGCSCQGGCNG